MLRIDFSLPEGYDDIHTLVDDFGLQPYGCSNDGYKAVLVYSYQGDEAPKHVVAAAQKLFGKKCSVTVDWELKPWKEFTSGAESDLLEALPRVLYIRNKANCRRDLDRFIAKHGLAARHGYPVPKGEASVPGTVTSSREVDSPAGEPLTEVGENGRSYALSNTIISISPSVSSSTFEDQFNEEYDPQRNSAPDSGDDQRQPVGRAKQHHDWQEMLENCELARRFEDGERLNHRVTWGLMTNYIAVDGGQDRFFDKLEFRPGYTPDVQLKWIFEVRKARQQNYRPTGCDKYCPFAGECNHGKNMLRQVLKPGQVRVIDTSKEESAMSLEAARELTKVYVQDAVTDEDRDSIHLIIIPTGVGKTEAVLGVQNAVLAAPTHDLAARNTERIRAAGNETCLVGDVPEYDPEFDARLASYHAMGAHSLAASLIKAEVADIRKRKPAAHYTPAEKALVDYDNSLKWLYETKLTANLTHARALNLRRDGVRETIIFDEDPLMSAMGFSEADLADLLLIKSKAAHECQDDQIKDTITRMVEVVEAAKNGIYTDVPRMICSKVNQLAQFVAEHCPEVQTDVLGIFEARTFVKVRPLRKDVVVYAKAPRLPRGKVIILSATASEELYKMAFPNRKIVVRRIDSVKQIGSIDQCCSHSLSKDQVERLGDEGMDKLLSAIAKRVGKRPVITRKDLKADLEAAGMNVQAIMHFGKCSGFDDLNGQDIAVVGTYALNPITYLLMASVLGVHFTVADQSMQYNRIEHDGLLFYAMAYQSYELRMIQLWMMQSELMQAIGRARHQSTEANVLVFASLPIAGARFFDLDLAA